MKQDEIQERNKQIALMLDWVESNLSGIWYKKDDTAIDVVYSEHTNYPHRGLPFHRDWNWLMEAVEFIERLSVYHMVETNRSSCVIYNGKNIITANYFKADKTKKEAVFVAVSDFAQKFNNKEL